MQLSIRADHAIRLLIYCALKGDAFVTVGEVARSCNASEHHMAKIANILVHIGVLQAIRGRNGGIRLAKSPEEINLGGIIRHIEKPTTLTECLAPSADKKGECPLMPLCSFRELICDAREAFFSVLDGKNLSQLITRPKEMRALMGLDANLAENST